MLWNFFHIYGRVVSGVVFATFFIPSLALAASLPATRDISVNPGESAEIEIPITNTGPGDSDFSIFLLSAEFQSDIEQPQLHQLSVDIEPWLSLSSSSLSVPSGVASSVTLSIHPPVNATSQTFTVAVVAAETLSGDIAIVHGNATLVFVTVGDVTPMGSCEGFVQNSSLLAHLSLRNTGRGILYSNGEVVLRGMFGIRFGTAPHNPLFHRVSSGQTRTWQVSLPPIPWWAFGPLEYAVLDEQLEQAPCLDINAGVRWIPIAFIFLSGMGVAILFIRSRIS